jgi:hypothetical protein
MVSTLRVSLRSVRCCAELPNCTAHVTTSVREPTIPSPLTRNRTVLGCQPPIAHLDASLDSACAWDCRGNCTVVMTRASPAGMKTEASLCRLAGTQFGTKAVRPWCCEPAEAVWPGHRRVSASVAPDLRGSTQTRMLLFFDVLSGCVLSLSVRHLPRHLESLGPSPSTSSIPLGEGELVGTLTYCFQTRTTASVANWSLYFATSLEVPNSDLAPECNNIF